MYRFASFLRAGLLVCVASGAGCAADAGTDSGAARLDEEKQSNRPLKTATDHRKELIDEMQYLRFGHDCQSESAEDKITYWAAHHEASLRFASTSLAGLGAQVGVINVHHRDETPTIRVSEIAKPLNDLAETLEDIHNVVIPPCLWAVRHYPNGPTEVGDVRNIGKAIDIIIPQLIGALDAWNLRYEESSGEKRLDITELIRQVRSTNKALGDPKFEQYLTNVHEVITRRKIEDLPAGASRR